MNPYGMTEVDIPGVLGAYEAGQTNRVRRMLYQQQAAAAERQAERDDEFRNVLAGAFGRGQSQKSGAAGAYGSIGDVVGAGMSSGSGGMIGTPPPAPPQAMPSPAAPQANATGLTPEIAAQLVSIDPERANQIITAFRTMDTAQVERTQRASLFMANRAQHLLANVPPDQWAAEIQRMAPELAEHGVNPTMIANFRPTEQSLRGLIMDAMDVERLAQVANPRPMVEPQGGRIIDVNRIDPATGAAAVLSESPTVTGPNGEVYARPPQMRSRQPNATPPQPGEVRRGYRYNGGDPASPQSWSPVGGAPTSSTPDLDNWNNAGRAGPQGPRTFR